MFCSAVTFPVRLPAILIVPIAPLVELISPASLPVIAIVPTFKVDMMFDPFERASKPGPALSVILVISTLVLLMDVFPVTAFPLIAVTLMDPIVPAFMVIPLIPDPLLL